MARTVQSLLDEATEKCGGNRKLAEAIGVGGPDLSEMRAGRRPISPMTVGLLCDVLELDGEEARRLAIDAIVATAKPQRAGVLRRAFFGRLGAGGFFAEGVAERAIRYGPDRVTTAHPLIKARSPGTRLNGHSPQSSTSLAAVAPLVLE